MLLAAVTCSALAESTARATSAETFAVEDYSPTFILGQKRCDDDRKEGRYIVALRTFFAEGNPFLLVVDAATLRTEVVPADDFAARPISRDADIPGYFTWRQFETSRYGESLLRYTGDQEPSENAGLRSAREVNSGVFLTVDLCPSVRPFETRLIEALAGRGAATRMRVPLALCASGLWAIQNRALVADLLTGRLGKDIDITWVNHSFSHNYYADLPSEENFLVHPMTRLESEILDTEKVFLRLGIVPSVFFRFPGLVSDTAGLATLRRLGLVPLGAGAWLAKGEPATRGSVVLVHGNGNEPLGIDRVLPLLAAGTLLLPISDAP